MKRRFHALIFACVMVSPLAHAGIPVLVDADPLREAEWLKEAQRWMQTAQHYQSQIQAYKDQLARPPASVILLTLLTRPKA